MLLPLQRLRKERDNNFIVYICHAQHRPKQPRSGRPQHDAPARTERLPLDTTTCPLRNAKQQNRKKDLAPACRRLHRAARMFCRTFACVVTPAYGGLLSIAKNAREVGLGSRKTKSNYDSSAGCVCTMSVCYTPNVKLSGTSQRQNHESFQISPSCQNLSGYGCSAAGSYVRAAVWQDPAQGLGVSAEKWSSLQPDAGTRGRHSTTPLAGM